jgi:aminotransferase in exopolysaccharide biosynthesis
MFSKMTPDLEREFNAKTDALITAIRSVYGDDFIPLHRPVFEGNERQYLVDCIDSNFVSSVGKEIVQFENMVCDYTGAKYAAATVNGTAALHAALVCAGVGRGDEVLSQALTFIATCNAISYTGAKPVFIDVDKDTMGMSPTALRAWLLDNTTQKNGQCVNKMTGAIIRACVPMHTFGMVLRISEIAKICEEFGITLVEDAAESLGSFEGGTHTGRFGAMATLSFNGNKVITTGGGGMVLTDDEELAKTLKHITTTAKVPHPTEFVHDRIGYNYRLPNLNAVLGVAQMQTLPSMMAIKTEIAAFYKELGESQGWQVVQPIDGTTPNNWLVALCMETPEQRDAFLTRTNAAGVMTRPIWRLMNELEMFKDCQHDGLKVSKWLEERIVNVSSGVPDARLKDVKIAS